MSADNTIFIREMPEGDFCVAHLISMHPGNCPLSEKDLDEYFSDHAHCRVGTRDKAWDRAESLFEDIFIVEYGIAEWPREDE